MIPTAKSRVDNKGYFELESSLGIVCSGTPFLEAHLCQRIKQLTSIVLENKEGLDQQKIITLDLVETGNESYELVIENNQISIKGCYAGLLYGIETLCQLLSYRDGAWSWPFLSIGDEPSFQWRGLMLDSSRHFISKKFILKYIDVMARMKMNVLHLHLNDDQGWRVEIKAYPELTRVGGFIQQGAGHEDFYTQEDIKELVAFAQKRNITIVPEIEIPGHAFAAMKSYPSLCCSGNPEHNVGHQNDLYCAGKEETFDFLKGVFKEIVELFPSEYIHIGGDEAPKDKWKECPYCQKKMVTENLKSEEELQAHMIWRVSEYLNSHGKKVIGWEEILDGKPSSNVVVQWWRNRSHGNEALKAALSHGHKVVMSPNSFCYLNFTIRPDEHFAQDRTSDLKKVYEAELVSDEISEDDRANILGIEACIWTEYLTEEMLGKMLFPRILALSELMWCNPKDKDFAAFKAKVKSQEKYWLSSCVTFGDY